MESVKVRQVKDHKGRNIKVVPEVVIWIVVDNAHHHHKDLSYLLSVFVPGEVLIILLVTMTMNTTVPQTFCDYSLN